ncbi:MAG: hypothetical protein ACR2QC_01485 [Gammaproteobacteria bacterium]
MSDIERWQTLRTEIAELVASGPGEGLEQLMRNIADLDWLIAKYDTGI